MQTNRDRVNQLKAKLAELNEVIVVKMREPEYLALVKKLAAGKATIQPIDDEQWEIMLPAEQDQNLVVYYHTLRTELAELTEQAKTAQHGGAGAADRVIAWLNQPWVKAAVTLGGLGRVGFMVVEKLQDFGLLFREEQETNYLA